MSVGLSISKAYMCTGSHDWMNEVEDIGLKSLFHAGYFFVCYEYPRYRGVISSVLKMAEYETYQEKVSKCLRKGVYDLIVEGTCHVNFWKIPFDSTLFDETTSTILLSLLIKRYNEFDPQKNFSVCHGKRAKRQFDVYSTVISLRCALCKDSRFFRMLINEFNPNCISDKVCRNVFQIFVDLFCCIFF